MAKTRQQREREAQAAQAMEMRDVQARAKAALVVTDKYASLAAVREKHGDEAAGAVFAAVGRLRDRRNEYETKLRWLQDAVAKALSGLEENTFYATSPIQNVDHLLVDYGRVYAAMEEVVTVERLLGIYVPLAHDVRAQESREKLLALRVVRTMGTWVVMDGEQRARAPWADGAEIPFFDEEWQAWDCVRRLTNRYL